MSKETPNDKPTGMTAADIQALVTAAVQTAIQEARKPAPATDKEIAEMAQEQQMRKDQAQLILDKQNNERAYQRICTHKHPARDGGASHCVWIVDGNYILCQKCQVKIRPVAEPEGYQGGDIYDVRLFNMLLQDMGTGAEIIG